MILLGSTAQESDTSLSSWDHTERSAHHRRQKFSLRKSFRAFEDVGSLVVKIYRAKGLYAADLGGSSDPFCVVELGRITHKLSPFLLYLYYKL